MKAHLYEPGNNKQVDRNPEATIYVGSIDSKASNEIIWELFSQCGVVTNVFMPKDKVTGEYQGFGFVEFRNEEDADYAIKIMHMVKLYGKAIKVNKASQDKKVQEVGANLFIGNLHPRVTVNMIEDAFSAFGLIISTRISRDLDTDTSRGYAFVNYDNFESSDAAIAAMDNQFFHDKVIQVSYAQKKDSKGEKHGSAAERLLAANRPESQRNSYQAFQQRDMYNNNQEQQKYVQQQTYRPQFSGNSTNSSNRRQQTQQTLHMPNELIPNKQVYQNQNEANIAEIELPTPASQNSINNNRNNNNLNKQIPPPFNIPPPPFPPNFQGMVPPPQGLPPLKGGNMGPPPLPPGMPPMQNGMMPPPFGMPPPGFLANLPPLPAAAFNSNKLAPALPNLPMPPPLNQNLANKDK